MKLLIYHQIELLNYEADDLIATYAKKITDAGAKVTVISSDKDLMQLVSNKIRLFDPMKSKVIGEKEVYEKFGVKPSQVIDVQSLLEILQIMYQEFQV